MEESYEYAEGMLDATSMMDSWVKDGATILDKIEGAMATLMAASMVHSESTDSIKRAAAKSAAMCRSFNDFKKGDGKCT